MKAVVLYACSRIRTRGLLVRSQTLYPAELCTQKRVKGIGPSYLAWKASVLPLNYTRVFNCNAQNRNRTSDTRIFSPLLYQLSYLGRKSFQCRRPGSNRYDTRVSQDFKSRASACSATPARSLTTSNIIPHLASVVKTFLKYFQRAVELQRV